jgi:hypothetical protein
MSLTPEQYVEFFVSVARGMYDRQLDIGAAAELCFTAAQPNAVATIVDILDDLKAELTDWIPSDLNSIHECSIVQIVFDSFDNPGDGEKRNVAQVVRLAVAPGWHWSHVHASRTNIDDAITAVGRKHLPDYAEDVQMVRRTKALGDQPIARGGFNPLFRNNIEAEVDKFREELDRLFPTQEGG